MDFAAMGTRKIYFAQVGENFRFTSGKHVLAAMYVDVSFWKVREGQKVEDKERNRREYPRRVCSII